MAATDPSLRGPGHDSDHREHGPQPPQANNDYVVTSEQPEPRGIFRQSLVSSFRYAFAGLAYCFRTQRNFRIHVALGLLVTVAGLTLTLSWVEWAVVAILVTLVLATEMVNTMVEALVDLVTQEYHPLARVAKDVAAGVVLLSAIGAVVVGALIFVPKIVALFSR